MGSELKPEAPVTIPPGPGWSAAETPAGEFVGSAEAGLRICIVDDHPLIREGLSSLLSKREGIEVVADASDGETACRALETSQPNLFIMDVSLPGVSGTTVAREILRRMPETQIVFFSMYVTEDYVADAVVAGARGYVGKNQPFRELVEALRTVAAGGTYLPPGLSHDAIQELIRLKRRRSSEGGPLGVLSTREREVFSLMVQGFTNDAAARELSISRRTVETHRANLLKKLNIHSVAELLRFAARHQLITN